MLDWAWKTALEGKDVTIAQPDLAFAWAVLFAIIGGFAAYFYQQTRIIKAEAGMTEIRSQLDTKDTELQNKNTEIGIYIAQRDLHERQSLFAEKRSEELNNTVQNLSREISKYQAAAEKSEEEAAELNHILESVREAASEALELSTATKSASAVFKAGAAALRADAKIISDWKGEDQSIQLDKDGNLFVIRKNTSRD